MKKKKFELYILKNANTKKLYFTFVLLTEGGFEPPPKDYESIELPDYSIPKDCF